jgi:hypothetical protein
MSAMAVGADAPLTTTIVPAGDATEPADGQVCVHVAKLVVTANTLTYAVAGNLLNAGDLLSSRPTRLTVSFYTQYPWLWNDSE